MNPYPCMVANLVLPQIAPQSGVLRLAAAALRTSQSRSLANLFSKYKLDRYFIAKVKDPTILRV